MSEVVSAADERMGTVTLTEFLLARIAEDEARAKSSYRVTTHDLTVRDMGDWIEVDGESMRPAEYLERFCEPAPDARVLAECEAKRRLIKRFPLLGSSYGREVQGLLATVYADHPDYREEWKP